MTYPGQGWTGQPPPDDGAQPPAGWGQPNQGRFPGQQEPGQQYGGQPYPGPPSPGQPYPAQAYPAQPGPGQAYPAAPYAGQPPLPGQPPYPAVQYPIGSPDGQQPVPPKRRRSGLTVGVIVAVVVLAAGGAGTWFALNRASTTGSASPQQAATKLLADVGNGDVLGIVNDLPPAEAGLLRDTITATTDQLKRLKVLKPDAASQSATGLKIHTSGITFDNAAEERVNDHLTVTKLVAGKITVSQGLSTNDFTDSFVHSAFPGGMPSGNTNTVDIADTVRQLGHPVRIATVEVGGKWYPSLFYSIADAALQAAHQSWPSRSVPPVGANSADDAVRQFVQAAMDTNVQGVIARTTPDEMAALHDAGQVLVDAAHGGQATGVRIDSATFADRPVPGGVDVLLRSMTMSSGGDQIVLTEDNGCYSVRESANGQTQRFCASDLAAQLQNGNATSLLPPEMLTLVKDMFTGLLNNGVGVVASQVDGNWYVSPGRTISQLAVDVYGTITPEDLAAVLKLGH